MIDRGQTVVFVWELWNGHLSPVKHALPAVGSLGLKKQREVAGTRHMLTDAEAKLPLDVLAAMFPAPAIDSED